MTMRAWLVRHETGDAGTFGSFMYDGDSVYSLELPDRGNQPNRSCVPLGKYLCRWTYSPAFKRMMYILDPVDGRSGIRIHPANLAGDVDKGLRSHLYGCIALGERRGTLHGQDGILVSRPAVEDMQDYFDGESFELGIING